MLDLQDAKRAVRLDLKADTIVAGAEPKVGRSLQTPHVAFTAHAYRVSTCRISSACSRSISRESALA